MKEYFKLFCITSSSLKHNPLDEKLNLIYSKLLPFKKSLDHHDNIITTESALMLQRCIIRSLFETIFGVYLKNSIISTLQYFNSPIFILILFLEYCGCPNCKLTTFNIDDIMDAFSFYAQDQLFKWQNIKNITDVGISLNNQVKMNLNVKDVYKNNHNILRPTLPDILNHYDRDYFTDIPRFRQKIRGHLLAGNIHLTSLQLINKLVTNVSSSYTSLTDQYSLNMEIVPKLQYNFEKLITCNRYFLINE